LIAYYHSDPSANHPPFITEVESLLLRVSERQESVSDLAARAVRASRFGTTFLLLLLSANADGASSSPPLIG